MPERIIVSIETADQTALAEMQEDRRAVFVAHFLEAIKSPVSIIFAPPGRKVSLLHYSSSEPPAKPFVAESFAKQDAASAERLAAAMAPKSKPKRQEAG